VSSVSLGDIELLQRWGDGDRAAGEELVARYFDQVYGFFRRKVGHAADDLVQETFLACLEARTRFLNRSTFRTFLFSIGRHILYAHYRTKQRDAEEVAPDTSKLVDPRASPTQEFTLLERERALATAYSDLPHECRQVLELVYAHGLSGNEVAGVLGVPVDTAYTRIRRAKLQLRERMAAQLPRPAGAIVPRHSSRTEGTPRWTRQHPSRKKSA